VLGSSPWTVPVNGFVADVSLALNQNAAGLIGLPGPENRPARTSAIATSVEPTLITAVPSRYTLKLASHTGTVRERNSASRRRVQYDNASATTLQLPGLHVYERLSPYRHCDHVLRERRCATTSKTEDKQVARSHLRLTSVGIVMASSAPAARCARVRRAAATDVSMLERRTASGRSRRAPCLALRAPRTYSMPRGARAIVSTWSIGPPGIRSNRGMIDRPSNRRCAVRPVHRVLPP